VDPGKEDHQDTELNMEVMRAEPFFKEVHTLCWRLWMLKEGFTLHLPLDRGLSDVPLPAADPQCIEEVGLGRRRDARAYQASPGGYVGIIKKGTM